MRPGRLLSVCGTFSPASALRFAFAIGIVLVACVVRIAANPVMGDKHPYTLFFAAIAITSWVAGFWPSITAIVLAYGLADWFFVTPRHELDLLNYSVQDLVGIVGFVFSGLAIAFTSRALRRAQQRAEARQTALSREMRERERVQRELEAATAKLAQHALVLERKVLERTANLRETIHSLEGVCYHIAHDLRAPLRAINSFSTILLEEGVPSMNPTLRDTARRVIQAAERMDVLSQCLIDYGRLSQQPLFFRNLDLEAEVEFVLGSISGQIQQSRAQVSVRRPLPAIRADAALVREILTELLSNSLKFIKPTAIPQVVIGADPAVSRLWIRDYGIGIKPEYQHNLFKIFHRLHPPGVYEGNGMGLAKVAKAIQRMSGSVGIESPPDGGTLIWLEFARPPDSDLGVKHHELPPDEASAHVKRATACSRREIAAAYSDGRNR